MLCQKPRYCDIGLAASRSQESPFAVMCRGAGKPTRENLKGLIAHYQWLETLVDPAPLLAPISEAKVAQWATRRSV